MISPTKEIISNVGVSESYVGVIKSYAAISMFYAGDT